MPQRSEYGHLLELQNKNIKISKYMFNSYQYDHGCKHSNSEQQKAELTVVSDFPRPKVFYGQGQL